MKKNMSIFMDQSVFVVFFFLHYLLCDKTNPYYQAVRIRIEKHLFRGKAARWVVCGSCAGY